MNEIPITRAVLISVDTGAFDAEVSIDELEELAATAHAQTVAKVIQKRPALDNATCVGTGKLQEIRQLCEAEDADLLIFDFELSATQVRNIEDIVKVRAIDRTTLILDIFASRARSSEGRLQVELAQQKYRLPRLAGMGVSMSRLGAGIGTRGPGESKLETDKRHIRRRIAVLERELAQLKKRRELTRCRRKKDDVLTAAIIGYTNVGKSTLLNALTGAGVLAENMLFATLDPTARSIELPDGRSVLLIDTVGLIRRLPHNLVEAFLSTLEEAANADLILQVCDASSDEADEQIAVTRQLLSELHCEDVPVLTVLNKCDRLDMIPHVDEQPDVAAVSALTGYGFDKLLVKMSRLLTPTAVRLQLHLPFDKASLLSVIRQDGKVFSETYTESGIDADVLVDQKALHLIQPYRQAAQS